MVQEQDFFLIRLSSESIAVLVRKVDRLHFLLVILFNNAHSTVSKKYLANLIIRQNLRTYYRNFFFCFDAKKKACQSCRIELVVQCVDQNLRII